MLAGAGAGNAGKMNWLLPIREGRFVRLCWIARRLAARSLVAVVVATSGVFELHPPLGVLAFEASIDGLLWWSDLLALTRTPRRRT